MPSGYVRMHRVWNFSDDSRCKHNTQQPRQKRLLALVRARCFLVLLILLTPQLRKHLLLRLRQVANVVDPDVAVRGADHDAV